MWNIPKISAEPRWLDFSRQEADVVIVMSGAGEEEKALINVYGKGLTERVEVMVDKGNNITRVSVNDKIRLAMPSSALGPGGVYAVSIRPKSIYFATVGNRQTWNIGPTAPSLKTKSWRSMQISTESEDAQGKLVITAKKSNWTSTSTTPPESTRDASNSHATTVGISVGALIIVLAVPALAVVVRRRRDARRDARRDRTQAESPSSMPLSPMPMASSEADDASEAGDGGEYDPVEYDVDDREGFYACCRQSNRADGQTCRCDICTLARKN